jgi:RNA polymerase sigma-70 factor, ECF subfamily
LNGVYDHLTRIPLTMKKSFIQDEPENPAEDILNKSDNELVELTLQKEDYFLHIMKRYKTKLSAYIRRISNVDEEETEDILQEIFIKVYLNLNDFNQDLKFSSWIYRITHNQVISHHRKKQARPLASDIDLYDDRVIGIADSLDVEKEMDRKILRSKISESLEKMDIKYKEILVLKFLEEKDYKEISDILKIPMGTVASRANKAKSELKKIISNIKI